MGMLATTGVVVSEDTFGPVADNAAGIAEMSGEFEGEPQRIMVMLDAVGNTTKAVTKGFAIGSAVIAAVALFSSYIETIKNQLPGLQNITGNDRCSQNSHTAINVADPKAVHRSADRWIDRVPVLVVRDPGGRAAPRHVVVQEVRRQFADGKIMSGEKRPDYAPVIDICTAASLRELGDAGTARGARRR